MRTALILICTALALGASPALSQGKDCPPGLAKKDPPCVPPGLAKKGVTSDDWSDRRDDDRDRYDRDDRDDEVIYDEGDLPRYLVRPNGRVIDLRNRRDNGWTILGGIRDDNGLPVFVMDPDGRIYRVDERLDDGWHLVQADDVIRLPRRDDGREFYLLDDEVVELVNREGEPYLRLLGALDDILN